MLTYLNTMLEMSDGKVLGPHQLSVVNRMLDPTRKAQGVKGLLVYHKMGFGKTLTAIACALQLRSAKVYIAAPKTVQRHWIDQCRRYNVPRFEVLTHEAGLKKLAANPGMLGPGSLLVVDESHNMRTPIQYNRKTQKIAAGTKARDMLLACQAAEDILLLTGTPVVNYASDLLNAACALHGKDDVAGYRLYRKLFKAARPQSLGGLSALFRDRVSVASGRVPDMPELVEKVVHMVMDPEHYKFYKGVEAEQILLTADEKDPWIFMNAVRRAVNAGIEESGPDAQRRFYGGKLKLVQTKVPRWLAKDAGEKIVIYTSWCEFGVLMLKDALSTLGVRCHVINGSTSAEERGRFVKEYNDGRVRVMLFTAAGAEGMDLRGTTRVVVVEPHWNPARTDQAVARAVRRGSHSHLPVDKRVVKVYRMLLDKPEDPKHEFPSVDLFMWQMAYDKDQWIKTVFEPWAADVSIERATEGRPRKRARLASAPHA